MADRYWVGGTASWDGTAGTKWATTSGGAGGASVPTSADDVFFTDLSTGTCTIATGNTGAKSINCTGFTGTIAGSAAISVAGSVTLVSGMGFTYTGTLTLTGTGTLTTAGKTLGPVTINGSGITVTLGSALTATAGTGTITLTAGTFDTASYNVTATSLSSSNSNTRTINLGSSTVTLSSTTPISSATSLGLTFNAGTSTIVLTGNVTSFNPSSASVLTFYNVSFTNTTVATRAFSYSGVYTYNRLTVAAPAAAGVTQVTFAGRNTFNDGLATSGTAGNRRVWFRGVTNGIAQTLTINGAGSLTDADFRDIYVIGTAAPISGTRIGDLRGIRGITASTPKTVYWVTLAGGSWSGNNWAATSGGAASTDNFPLAQDTAVIQNTGLNASATITLDTALQTSISGVDMSTRTNAMTLSTVSGVYNVYGDWKNGAGTTISGSTTIIFSGRNTQTITSAGKTFAPTLEVDSYGGTVELSGALTTTGSIGVTNGTFDTKNFNVTAFSLISNNSNIRAITLGSSILTLSSSAPVVFTTSTNLTLTAGTSQINITSSTAPTITATGLTFYNVSFTGTAVTNTTRTITGSNNTFNNLTFSAGSSASLMECVIGGNQTITGTLTCAGATAVRRIFLRSDTIGTQRDLTVGTLSANDCDFRDIDILGTAIGTAPTRAGDCGGNNNITFPAPKTVYWNLAGAQSWSATGWATSSGGTPDINNFPLAQDTAVFDNTGSVTGTISIDRAWNIGTFNASARTSAMTLNPSVSFTVYGDWSFGTGVTMSSAATTITFADRATATITSNGRSFNAQISINCVGGAVVLADALTVASSSAGSSLVLNSGTFDAVSYNVTLLSFFNNSATTTLKMGSGTWTLTSTGTVWSMATNPSVFYKGTANIVLSDTSTGARTFAGGGLSYNKLTIGGTTGTSTLTISSNNQFTELASTKTVAHTIALGTTTQTFGKWTVTGTAGNVVTLTGTGTSHVLAGACTSGIDYLAMGSIGFASTSPGEFYAGANSTGTAGNPVYRTAKPADSIRYWVGGTGNWSDTARWSTSSGGAGGASVPRSHDDVVFDSASNATAYTATINTIISGVRMKSLTISGPASGNVTLSGSDPIDGIHGNVTFPATGLTRTFTGSITLSSSSTGLTFTTNGVSLSSAIIVNGVSCAWALGSALNISTGAITITNGSLDFATYNVTANLLSSDNGNSRTLSLGSGTITLQGSSVNPTTFGTTETSRANLTLNAGTSSIVFNASTAVLTGNNQTFYNASFTNTSAGTVTINGANTFNNLSVTGITSAGLKNISVTANQTINGTLTLSAGTDATMRHFVQSDTLGTTRTLTCAAFSGTDADFRDITIAGAAAPVSGTRLGDCKGNSGITFDAAKTVYWNLAGNNNWSATAWATTSGGTPAANNFPLAQDTAIFESTSPATGATTTINAAYNIGTIDMSARTSNTMTLACTIAPTVYKNWINGTGITQTGTTTLTFAGRGSQTITSAGITFTTALTINSPGGTVTLQDALTCSSAVGIAHTAGTFDAAGYNLTLTATGSSAAFNTNNSNTRTVAIGSGTWTIAGSSTPWNATTTTNLTVTGTGTISLTSASAKTFAGGGISYSGITLNQGGAGTLTITGNNTFNDITNTYSATGATSISLGNTTQNVTQWTATGASGRVLTVQGASASSPATLVLTGPTDATVNYLTITGVRAYNLTDTWYAGVGSTNNGSLGWYFDSTTPPVAAGGNFFLLFL